MAARLARFSVDHRVAVLVAAVVVFAACGAVGSGVFERMQPYGALAPGSESVETNEALERATGAQPAPGLIVLLRGRPPVTRDPDVRRRLAAVERILRDDRLVARVTDLEDPGVGPALVSERRDAALVIAAFRVRDDRTLQDRALELEERIHEVDPEAGVGGYTLANADANRFVEEDVLRAEAFAIPIIVVLAFVFFRSLVAAAIPPLVGVLAVLATLMGLRLAAEATDISVYAVNISTGLGLGLAIDYSLLFVSRYREERAARGGDVQEALAATLATAGHTVIVSSLTVTAALASLLVFPQRFLYSMGLGGAIVSAAAAGITLLVLPAVLALLGPRVDALAPARLKRAAEREASVAREGRWFRTTMWVSRRPARVAIPVGIALLAAGVPFLRAEFAAIDERVLPPGNETRAVSEAARVEFGGTLATPVILLVPDRARAREVARAARRVEGVTAVTPPQPAGRRDGVVLNALLARDAMSDASQRAVRALRRIPGVRVTGATAEFLDTRTSIVDHLPLAALIVALTSAVAVFGLTRSVVLPLKAILMNVVTLTAVLGVLVLIFQDGRLEGLLGYESVGTLELTMPVLIFATAFGLSTDYGVFLLARITEEHNRGAPNDEAVAVGLERTGRIVTAAAVLFTVAFGSFVTCRLVFMKEAAIGVAASVLIDATIIRALLVPAMMSLLGDWNWWSPFRSRRPRAAAA